MGKFLQAIDNFWQITEKKSTIRNEVVGGITTFMAMAYILIVNPNITAGTAGVRTESIFIGTCIGALVGTLMMAFYAKIPFAQAPGMGLNAYFAYTVVGMQLGERQLTYANACFIVLISGVIFFLLTIFGIREKIVDSVPYCIKNSITAGIGLFIAFVGLQNSKIIRLSTSTLVTFAPLNFVEFPFEEIWPTLLVLLTFLIICVLSYHKVRGGILWGILIGTILHYIIGYAGGFIMKDNAAQIERLHNYNPAIVDFASAQSVFPSYVIDPSVAITVTDPAQAFKNWGIESAAIVFREGWKNLFVSSRWFSDLLNIIAIVLAFAMVDMFDTIGTLLGTARRAGMLDEDGRLPNIGKALLCDSVGTMAGTVCGVSTVTTFVESSAGINEGAKTGFASFITSICFFISLWLSPLAQVIPSTATTPALLYVGVLMISSIADLDFNDVSVAAPAFQTIAFMPFSYNISIGIALGLLTHTFIKLISGIIYLIKSRCCNESSDFASSTAEKEEGAEMDALSESSSSNSSSSSTTTTTNTNHAEVDADVEDPYENTRIRQQPRQVHMTNKQKGISELKQIHPITVVIDILFLIYFFCARR